MADNGRITITLAGDADQLRRTLRGASKDVGGLAGAAQKLQKNWLLVGSAMAALEGSRRLIGGMISGASDLAESVSKVNVVFGESSAEIRDWAGGASTALGLAEQAALASAGSFGNLFTAMGLTQGQASELSRDVVQMGVDLTSFNNLAGGTEEALTKLRAGLVGEAEPLRVLGINISAATTKAKGLELGLVGVGNEFTVSEKVIARWAQIVEQSSNAAGDFARTADGLANSSRTLGSKLTELQTDLGTKLIPAAETAVDVAIGLLDALDELAQVGVITATVNLVVNTIRGSGGDGGGPTLLGGSAAVTRFIDDAANEIAFFLGGRNTPAQELIDEFFRNNPLVGTGTGIFQGALTPASSIPLQPGAGVPSRRFGAGAPSMEVGEGNPFLDLVRNRKRVEESIGSLSGAESTLASLREGIARSNTADLVNAYFAGGEEQVAIVRAQQEELDATWQLVAENLREVVGIEMPLEYRGAWEQMLEIQREGVEKAKEAERDLARERGAAAASGFTKVLLANARAGFNPDLSVEDFFFDLDRELTPLEKLIAGQTTPTINVEAVLQLSDGQEAQIFAVGREAALSTGLIED